MWNDWSRIMCCPDKHYFYELLNKFYEYNETEERITFNKNFCLKIYQPINWWVIEIGDSLNCNNITIEPFSLSSLSLEEIAQKLDLYITFS